MIKKIWFFRTRSGEIFAIDDENKAWNYYRPFTDKEGRIVNKQRLPYIGWSDGKINAKYIKEAKSNIIEDEMEYNQMIEELELEIKATRDLQERKNLKKEKQVLAQKIIALYDQQKNIIKEGLQKEIEAAQNNLDKTPPRDMSYLSYNTKQPLSEIQRAMMGNLTF